MAEVRQVLPVKYFVAVLFREKKKARAALEYLEKLRGDIDFCGEDYLFDVTEYYTDEMGSPLYRQIISFDSLWNPCELVGLKLQCNSIEDLLSEQAGRTVNLDAGYLDHNKVLLASAKEAGQKIYLDRGIYADLAARYKDGRYRPFEWSFPDFRDGRYDWDLLTIRSKYLEQIRRWKRDRLANAEPQAGFADS